MWIELVKKVCSECTFEEPSDKASIEEVARALLVTPPEKLTSFWLEADGILDEYGDGIWSVEETIHQNTELRRIFELSSAYMSFDSMFCFAGAGNGDLYFFPIQADGKVNRPDIFLWNHETDSREWASPRLEHFVEAWYSGSLSQED